MSSLPYAPPPQKKKKNQRKEHVKIAEETALRYLMCRDDDGTEMFFVFFPET